MVFQDNPTQSNWSSPLVTNEAGQNTSGSNHQKTVVSSSSRFVSHSSENVPVPFTLPTNNSSGQGSVTNPLNISTESPRGYGDSLRTNVTTVLQTHSDSNSSDYLELEAQSDNATKFPSSFVSSDFYLNQETFSYVTTPNCNFTTNCNASFNNSLSGNGSNESDYEDYVYDYSDADLSLPLDEILPVSLVYGVTLVVGVVGNLLVIAAVARDRRLRSITNIFLTSLACADLALLCFCVPVKCIAFFSFSWAFGFFLCKSVHYFQIVTMICSVMTLTVMSIERNIAILSPLRSKRICTRRRARIVVVLLWASSVVLALPILVGQKHKLVGGIRKAYWCIKEWDEPIYGILFESYMLILLFMVPVGVMVVSYTTICMELSRGTKFRRQATSTQCTAAAYRGSGTARFNGKQQAMTGNCSDSMLQGRHKERMDKEKMKVIRMLIVVVVLFAICWGPILINNLLVSLGVLNMLHYGHLKPLRQAMFLMSYLNSSLNPLVYGFMSRHFRRGFREAICVCCSKSGHRGGENRLTRGRKANNNMSCYYASDTRGSTVRTCTVRLSPVTEQGKVVDDEELDESPVGTMRYSRKVWARIDRVSQGLQDTVK